MHIHAPFGGKIGDIGNF